MADIAKAVLAGKKKGGAALYVEDVFLTNLRVGTGATVNIATPFDTTNASTLCWTKGRVTYNHKLVDSTRGATLSLGSNTTAAEATEATGLTAFTSSGVTLGADASYNTISQLYVDWIMKDAAGFKTTVEVNHTTGTPTVVGLSVLGTVGMVEVKRTDSTSNWYTWHKGLTTGKLLYLNLSSAETTDSSISVSGTNLTLASALPTGTYIVYGYADNEPIFGENGDESIIKCGVFDGTAQDISLGWEPQYVLTKSIDISQVWVLWDTMRGLSADGAAHFLYTDVSSGEGAASVQIAPYADGIRNYRAWGSNVIYMAIRRPHKVPTSGTEVLHIERKDVTGSYQLDAGFTMDSVFVKATIAGINSWRWVDRLRGEQAILSSDTTGAEFGESYYKIGNNFGVDVASYPVTGHWSILRRAPKFYDTVCYTGTGVAHTEAHNLKAVPELMIVKRRSNSFSWYTYDSLHGATNFMRLETTVQSLAGSTLWNDTEPTDVVFTVGTTSSGSSETYIAHLFATLAGISKVGSYTGNGTSLTLDCGFSAGARFFLCKRTDSAGDWFMWDSVRGIVAGNDPHLSLNTNAAEITTDDSVDPDSSGIIVNQVAATNINVTSATYIYLAIA